jgi:hypothetical protein
MDWLWLVKQSLNSMSKNKKGSTYHDLVHDVPVLPEQWTEIVRISFASIVAWHENQS